MAIQLNVLTKIVEITTPTTAVTVQELVNAIRDFENELEHLSYNKVIDAVGKASLGAGVVTGIIMTLNSDWQIQFFGGSGYTEVRGGTVVGGVGSKPIKATGTANDITVQIQPTDATIVTSGGSALTSEEHNWLSEVNDTTQFIENMESGKWAIVGTQMIFYKPDNTTELCRFNLFNKAGSPASDSVYKREKV